MANFYFVPNLHVFGLWEETGAPGKKTYAGTGRTCELYTERPQLVVIAVRSTDQKLAKHVIMLI